MRPQNQSRRSFIKGIIASGTVASTGVMLNACSDGTAPTGAAPAAGSVERLLSLNVNGTERRVDVLPNETLAQTLRNKLNLTGTKLACDRGECGACTVLIDGVPHNSCSTLTHTVRSAQVQTIEGVANADGTLHPLQNAMIEELGPQCGFCTPGQIMSGLALLQRNPNPTRDECRAALAGNLCRCGAYDQYLNAVLRAAQEMA
jgi:aerobic-type carbon monoxide dehydrogenase small subunit (CoxS/CutS family)